MKLTVKLSDVLSAELEASDQKDIFEELSSLQEVFGQNQCGKCKGTNLKFQVREVDGNKFYETRCQSCGAKLSFGAHKKGNSIFPRRKDSEGKYLNNGGWLKWNKEKGIEE